MTKVTRVYEVDEEQFKEVHTTVRNLLKKLFGTDEEGDPNVEFKLIDRQRTGPLHFVPQPYSHKDPEGAYRIALLNLGIAASDANVQDGLRQHDKQLMIECCYGDLPKDVSRCSQCGCGRIDVIRTGTPTETRMILCQYHWYVEERKKAA